MFQLTRNKTISDYGTVCINLIHPLTYNHLVYASRIISFRWHGWWHLLIVKSIFNINLMVDVVLLSSIVNECWRTTQNITQNLASLNKKNSPNHFFWIKFHLIAFFTLVRDQGVFVNLWLFVFFLVIVKRFCRAS